MSFISRSGTTDKSSYARVDGDGKLFIKSTMTSGGNTTATTAATGTDWVAFPAQACDKLVIGNDTGTVIEFRQGGSGAGFPVFDGQYCTVLGITNANQIEVRRKDVAITQVAVKARWEA